MSDTVNQHPDKSKNLNCVRHGPSPWIMFTPLCGGKTLVCQDCVFELIRQSQIPMYTEDDLTDGEEVF